MNTWRYQAWDIEAQAPCIETIAYSIVKTRFLFHETGNDSTWLIRIHSVISNKTLSSKEFILLNYKISCTTETQSIWEVKKLSHQFNGKTITLHNLPFFISEVAEKVGKCFILLKKLTIDFARISAIIDKKDEKISKQYCGDYPLATIPYIRHTLYMSAILGINECTDEEIGSMYSLLYLSRDESLLIVQRE